MKWQSEMMAELGVDLAATRAVVNRQALDTLFASDHLDGAIHRSTGISTGDCEVTPGCTESQGACTPSTGMGC